MAIAQYKDLCVDAVDPAVLGRFYATLLGLKYHAQDGGDSYLTGPTPQHTVWVNGVPEPKSVKHRVHLDVTARSVADVQDVGATVIDGESFDWTVMADPERGEFCVFVRPEPSPAGLKSLAFDAADHQSIAAWWHAVLGGELEHHDGYSSVSRAPGVPFESLDFASVPEAKATKNRVHIDVTTDDIERLIHAGASVIRTRDDEIAWTVMADPDGNEFCAFTA